MLQSDNFIHNVEEPYHMESILRVKNCLYARYTGPEDKVNVTNGMTAVARISYDKVTYFDYILEKLGFN